MRAGRFLSSAPPPTSCAGRRYPPRARSSALAISFPQAAGAIALGRPEALADVMDAGDVPDVPHARVAYVDGYGNLKTTIRSAPRGARTVRVRIGDVTLEAVVSDGSFAVQPRQLAFAPGSSGWPLDSDTPVRWMELFLRGGNAWDAFGRPSIAAHIEVSTT
jgi:hypothetical protein